MQYELFHVESPKSSSTVITEEEWKNVPNFEAYEVSSMGRFRRKKDCRYLSGTCSHNGYLHVGFTSKGKQYFKLAHRIVAEAFLVPTSPNHCVVNHINYVRNDNRVSNLEWSTRSWNSKHAHRKKA